PSDDWRMGVTLLGLGRALSGLSRYADAESVLLEAYRVIDIAPKVHPKDLQSCTEALDSLYQAWDAAEPGKGHDVKRRQWLQKKRDSAPLPATTQAPAATEPGGR